jgi:hypothetical protein
MTTASEPATEPADTDTETIDLDLTTCDREPIHIPGAIQPHGILFALSGPDLHVKAVSANVADHLGIDPQTLLNRSGRELLDEASFLAVQDAAIRDDGMAAELLPLCLRSIRMAPGQAAVRATPDGVLLELKLAQTPMKPLAPVTKILTFNSFPSEAFYHDFGVIGRRWGSKIAADEFAPASIIGRGAKLDHMILQRLPADNDEIPERVFDRPFEPKTFATLRAFEQRDSFGKAMLELLFHA